MISHQFLAATLIVVAACARGSNEDSAICGLTHLASVNKVLDQASSNAIRELRTWPENVPRRIRVRSVGYGTGWGIVGHSSDGVIIGFEGEGFPASPGFAVALIDDSSEVFRGVLIYDMDVPAAFEALGGVAGTDLVIPMYAFRINWSAVNDPGCPIFAAPETSPDARN